MSNYLSFLKWLLSLGPNLPTIFEELKLIVESFKRIMELAGKIPVLATPVPAVPVPGGGLSIYNPSPEEMKLEGTIAEQVAAPNALWNVETLRGIFVFLKDSGLLDIIIAFFNKGQ